MFSKKLHAQYRVVAYDPSKPPEDGPVVWEVFEAERNMTHVGKKLGEFSVTNAEAPEIGRNESTAKHLQKAKLIGPNAKVHSQDGDIGSELLYVEDGDDSYHIYVSVKKGYEQALDHALAKE